MRSASAASNLARPLGDGLRRSTFSHLLTFSLTLCALGISPALAADDGVRAAEGARIDVMTRAAQSVVCIFDEKRSGGGSGVIITPDGYGLTNFHVVADMLATRRGLGGMADGKLYPLEVLGIDITGDLAMFRLTNTPPTPSYQGRATKSGAEGAATRDDAANANAKTFVPAPLGDSDTVQIGDWVFAMGNPFLLAEDYTPTVTHGIVSGTHRYQFGADGGNLVYTDCIQVDASINPGNSGGPLFDMQGRLIGINGRASFEQRGRVNVGLGYAISINQIKRFMPGLRAGKLVEHGALGATVVDLGYNRVVFEKMLESSPAATAGIDVGDRLVSFAGREIHSANQFLNILGTFPAGWPVEVVFEHEGRTSDKTVRLEPVHVKLDSKLKFERAEADSAGGAATSPAPAPVVAMPPLADSTFAAAFEQANRRTVKLYGAGIGTQRGYQTGVIISPDGKVVTVLSLVLEASEIRAVAHDGHVYTAELLYRDDYRQLALLKMSRHSENVDTHATVDEQMSAPKFEPFTLSPDTAGAGDWILTVGNPFKVAEGDEPLSVMKGIVSGRTRLAGEHGTQDFPYVGDVLLVDAITSGPGSAGGAVVDLQGRLVGLAGKMVTSRLTNTLLNYAMPAEEIAAFLRDAEGGSKPATRPAIAAGGPGYHGIQLSKIAYHKQLPFVKSVAKGSPAEAAGLRADDLIVSANGTAIPRGRDFTELCDRLHAGDELSLIVKRGEQLVSIRMTLGAAKK